jgi:hypothetical protein
MDLEKVDNNIVLDESIDSNKIGDVSLTTLSIEDWITIQTVRSSFLSVSQNDIATCCSADVSDRTSALISWSHIANQIALRFINFFRQIDEFEGLNADDRFILIKYNIFSLFSISKCFNYDPKKNCFTCEETEESKRHREFYTLCFQSNGILDTFGNLVLSFVEITQQDPILLSLFAIILLFSQGLSMNEDEPSLKDPLAVGRAQSYYTQILWNYMVNKQGETKTCKQFSQLLTGVF